MYIICYRKKYKNSVDIENEYMVVQNNRILEFTNKAEANKHAITMNLANEGHVFYVSEE